MQRSESWRKVQAFCHKRLRNKRRTPSPVPLLLIFAWIVYSLQSILFPLSYIISDDKDFTSSLLSYITHAISSAISLLIAFILVIIYLCRNRITNIDSIKLVTKFLIICNIVLKFLFYDLNADKKEYQYVCIVEVIFVSYWIWLLWRSALQSLLIFGCYLLYGALSNLVGRHPQTVLIVQYFIAIIPILVALRHHTSTGINEDTTRKLSLIQQRRLWEDHLKNLPDLVLIIDENRQVLYRNQAYCKLSESEGLNTNSPFLLSRIPQLRLKENDHLFKQWFKDMLKTTSEYTDMNSTHTMRLFQTQTSNRKTWKTDLMASAAETIPRRAEKKGKYSTYALNIDLGVLIATITKNMESYSTMVKDKVLILYGKMYKYDNTQDSYEVKISISKEGEKQVLFIILTETTHRDKVLKLEEVSEFKNRLLGSFSHELRTPLNGNMNFLVTALEDAGISAFAKEKFIDPALKCSQLLMYVVNDILDYSQMATNTLTLNFSKQDLTSTIDEVIEVVKMQANQKNIKLSFKKDNSTPNELRTDFQRLKQVLVNLFRNALSKTFSGEILLEITASEQFPDIYRFTVSDTGIEIPPEEQEVIKTVVLRSITKERYTKDPTKDTSGSHISLKLATSIAELLSPPGYGGIRFESNEGKGSDYHFYIEDREEGLDHVDIDISNLNEGKKEYSRRDSQQLSRQNTFKKAGTLKFLKKSTHNKAPSESSLVQMNINDEENLQASKNFECNKEKTNPNQTDENTPLTDRHPVPYEGQDTKLHLLTRKQDFAYLPITSTDPRTPKIEESKSCECNIALVVDDDAFNILSLGVILNSFGLKYEEAYNGQLALNKIKAKKPCSEGCRLYSVIFMDCNMPVKDGYETTIELKKLMDEGSLPRIPIVACTAYIIDYQASKCKECGMDEYLSKPVDKKLMREILKKRGILTV